jgi:crotonobetainyl-CoA:carnitine CoA-transferase CaiB-like acyl-CoA transferase
VQGVRVIDCTRVLAGPFATQHLADQGADVVKVEPPGGDETRGYGPVVDGESTYFLALHRNKRSIVIDLRCPEGVAVLDRLLDGADVLVENARPDTAANLGFDPARVAERHPRLVHVSIRGFHPEVPDFGQRPGYDVVVQALGGGMALTGSPDRPPVRSALPIADLFAGLLASNAVLHGLFERERTGRGGHVVVDMLQASAGALTYHATRATVGGGSGPRRGNAHAGLVPYDAYPCADGWLAVGCGNDGLWRRLCAALSLNPPPGLDRNVDRVARRAEVDALVAAALAPWPLADADRRLADAGVPAAPVLTPEQTLAHPAVRTVTVPHPTFGDVALVGPMWSTSSTRTEHTAPPALGAHTDDLLAEVGFAATDIARLRATSVVG